ncbi:MAG: PfkB family carbohydrate kinase, partial [Actinomycetota bacterium]
HRLRAPSVQVRSTVGAGDSMDAGMADGIQRGMSADRAAALGVAAGTAAVLTDGTGLCRLEDVERLLSSVAVG